MTQPFEIGGAQTVIPGVYDKFRVDDSLLTPAVAGRSALILGEASEGIPGSLLDLSLNYFTSYPDVLAFYKTGPLVDAARQLFSTQIGAAFNGKVDRLYTYKTNLSTRAYKAIANSYGNIVSARYGEPGNFIKSQIVSAQAEILPSLNFHYLPSSGATTIKLALNGNVPLSVSMGTLGVTANTGTAAQLVTAVNALSGVVATGGVKKTNLASGTSINVAVASPSAGVLSLTLTSGTWSTSSIAVGDMAVIPLAGSFSGTANANSGCYTVQSVTTTALILKRVSGLGVSSVAFDLTALTAGAATPFADGLGIFSEVVLTQN